MTAKVIAMQIKAGIQRDGTQFNAPTYTNGQWCRFQNGLPKKMGGYVGIFNNAAGISRGMLMVSANGLNYIVSGFSYGLQHWSTTNESGTGFGPSTYLVNGPVATTSTLVAGTAYTAGTYTLVALTGGTGTGIQATVVVAAGGLVSSVVITFGGNGYAIGDVLGVPPLGTTGSGASITVVTTTYFTPDANNLWQFDIGYNSSGGMTNNIVAHPTPNLSNIDSSVNSRPLVGQFTSTTLSPVGVFTALGTTTSGSTNVTFATTISAIGAGVLVNGPNIPANTSVKSVSTVAGVWTAVLSAPATAAGTVTLNFDNQIAVSGGIVILHPYLFAYGNNGLIQNSAAGDFNNWTSADANFNNVSTGKVVKGLPLRGGNTSPAGLFWTLDSLVRVSYAPSTTNGISFYWKYDLVTSQTSIMSSQSVIEYDGIFYWAAVDRFCMYNGTVTEIPNGQNMNWFFDNINYAQRQKVWVTKVPRWGEIWFFYPRGNATECTDAVIYNVRDKSWYDAGSAPGAARSAGTFSEVFRRPIWAGNVINPAKGYTLWQHETGTNQVYQTQVSAVQSFFDTNSLSQHVGLVGSQSEAGENVFTRVERIEPDFVQVGSMNVYVLGKGYANDADYVSTAYTFLPTTLKIDMREQRREIRLRFESNTQDGDYFAGRVMLSIDTGDRRSTGNP